MQKNMEKCEKVADCRKHGRAEPMEKTDYSYTYYSDSEEEKSSPTRSPSLVEKEEEIKPDAKVKMLEEKEEKKPGAEGGEKETWSSKNEELEGELAIMEQTDQNLKEIQKNWRLKELIARKKKEQGKD